jgi:Tfp pilus assembly protein PilN
MQTINFATKPVFFQKKFKKWIFLSVVCLLGLLILLAAMSAYQINIYFKLTHKKQDLIQVLHKKSRQLDLDRIARAHYENYKKLTHKIEIKNLLPHEYIVKIASLIPATVLISSFSYKLKKKLHLSGTAKAPQNITEFIRNLTREKLFKTITMKYIKTVSQSYQFDIDIML